MGRFKRATTMYRSERVAVPREMQMRLLALCGRIGKGEVCKLLGISKWTYDDAVAEGGNMIPKTLQKLEQLLSGLDADVHAAASM